MPRPHSASMLALLPLALSCACGDAVMSPGVAAVTPKGILVDTYDHNVARAVHEELSRDAEAGYDSVRVDVHQGVVVLQGRVPTLLGKERAEQIAQAVRGVRAVVNRIDVVPRLPRTDRALQADAEQALAFDAVTNTLPIRVQVEEGVARLTGRVGSKTEAELARQVVSAVSGLRAVDDALEVAPSDSRTDFEIKNEVNALLRGDVRLNASMLQVGVKDGTVRLSGTVGSLGDLNRATSKSWVRGVKQVNIDDLEIADWARSSNLRPAARAFVPDQDVQRTVQLALFYDPRVPERRVRVDVREGVVVLSGEVDTLASKRAAFEDAQGCMGAKAVEDRLTLRPFPIGDDDVRAAIHAALERHPFLGSEEIAVTVDEGTVELRGSVQSPYERAAAQELVEQVRGVREINNQLLIRTRAKPAP
jgi:osmotically-inducible protein OsmY